MKKTPEGKTYLFESARVPDAVMRLVIPAVLSQIVSLIYNMTDTFYVGQLGDPDQVAAVSLAAPAMLAVTALANLFGIGAASTASRFIGAKKYDSAKRATAFGFYAAVCIAAALSVSAMLFTDFFLKMLGASGGTMPHTKNYLFWVFIAGGIPTLLSLVASHFIRADGAPKTASFGLSMGGILNVIINPFLIFDFAFGMGVAGAALGTFIANTLTLAYFLRYFFVSRKNSNVSLHPRWFTAKREIAGQVLLTGLPGMLQTLLASVSNTVLNQLAKGFGSEIVAALGIAKKIDTIPMSVTIGVAQGVMPMLGFNYAAKNGERVRKTVKFSLALAIGFSVLCVAVFQIFAFSLVNAFIREAVTVSHGVFFLRVMCISTPLMAVGFIMITLFQAAGASKQALVLSVLRKGLIDIPLMIALNLAFPLTGLAFVQPVTEFAAMAAAIAFYVRFSQRISKLDI